MRVFLDDNFLLTTDTARRLFHEVAADLPIVDYHCHLNPREIYENRRFANLTEIWLGGDHYKWRLLRANGVDEDLITGAAPDREKFDAFVELLPLAIGNPLYHWSALELKRYFGFDGIPSAKTADEIWTKANAVLADKGARDFILDSNVEVIVTTDDPADSLEWHEKLAADDSFKVQVLPGWRPDKAFKLEEAGFGDYIAQLSEVSGVEIRSYADLLAALEKRLDFFRSRGCKVTDHGLNTIPVVSEAELASIDELAGAVFDKRLGGGQVSPAEADQYRMALLLQLSPLYKERDMVFQVHYNTMRNTNSRMFARTGADAGFDTMGDQAAAQPLRVLLDALDKGENLPKTVIYSLNGKDNEMLIALLGCYQGEVPGKMQHGVAWWMNDTRDGMVAQLKSYANSSLLGNFIGMLTDSRSFLSYARHEYFRRILCELIGGWVEAGEYPNDEEALEHIVRGICHDNSMRFIGF